MTAPGDLVLIFLLLALFVACSAYAAGRIHQRRQLKQDRDEAFRDGYETASDRVFSLAVRSVLPKRARGSAEPVAGDPGRAVRHQGVATPGAEASAGSSPAVRHQGVATPGAETSAGSSPAVPASPPHPRQRRSSESAWPAAGLGFPVPMPPPPNTLVEPPAVGGVNYQPFPDPRSTADADAKPVRSTPPADAPAPMPAAGSVADPTPGRSARSAADPVPPRSAPSARSAAEPAPARSARPADDSGPGLVRSARPVDDSGTEARRATEESSGGKHTVPDELVRAATYRLPPDRVFRAKVPNSTILPEETTTNIPVQKPRRP